MSRPTAFDNILPVCVGSIYPSPGRDAVAISVQTRYRRC